MSTLAQRTVIVRYEVSSYLGEKTDNEKADKLSSLYEKSRQETDLSVKKMVLGRPKSLVDCAKHASYIRTQIQANSIIPYTKGSVIVAYHKLPEFSRMCQKLAAEYKEKVDRLIDDLPNIVENVKLVKGDIVSDSEIPSAEYLRSKFGFSITAMPVPSANNFDELLNTNEEIEKLKEEYNSDLEKVSKKLNNSLLGDITDRLLTLKLSIKNCKNKLDARIIKGSLEKAAFVKENNVLDNNRLVELANKLESIVNQPAESFSKPEVKQLYMNQIDQLLGL